MRMRLNFQEELILNSVISKMLFKSEEPFDNRLFGFNPGVFEEYNAIEIIAARVDGNRINPCNYSLYFDGQTRTSENFNSSIASWKKTGNIYKCQIPILKTSSPIELVLLDFNMEGLAEFDVSAVWLGWVEELRSFF